LGSNASIFPSIYLSIGSCRSTLEIKIDKAINPQVNGRLGKKRAEGCRKVKVYRVRNMVKSTECRM